MKYLRRVLPYLRPYWKLTAVSVALILLGALDSLLAPWPLKYLVDLSNAVYLHKHSFWSQGTAIGVLLAWGVAGVAVAAFKFRWEPRES